MRRRGAPSCGTRGNPARSRCCARILAGPPASAGGSGGCGRWRGGYWPCARPSEEVRPGRCGVLLLQSWRNSRLPVPRETPAELWAPAPVFKACRGHRAFCSSAKVRSGQRPGCRSCVRMVTAACPLLLCVCVCVCVPLLKTTPNFARLCLFFWRWGEWCSPGFMGASLFLLLKVQDGRIFEEVLQRQSERYKTTDEREENSEMVKAG